MTTGQPKIPAGASAPPCSLLVMCVECGRGIEVPLPTDRSQIDHLLAQQDWFMSVLTPPNQDPSVPIVVGALCANCAPAVYPPEVLRAAKERRLKLLERTP